MAKAITFDAICEAHARIAPWVRVTPVATSGSLNRALGCEFFFKCENLQKAGAFKSRGACNAVFALTEKDAARGVATHSSGNHGAALARSAKLRGIPAFVVMPSNAKPNKIAAARAYGAEVVFCEPGDAAREAACRQVIERTNGTLIHPFDNSAVIAGQGTAAVEFLDQVGDLDALMVPVGGGGLLAGSLIATRALRPNLPVIAAEPSLADDMYRSWKSGRRESPLRHDTVADGLRTCVGELTYPIIRSLVSEVLTASETSIVRATRLLIQWAKLVVEPSAAVPLAVVMEHPEQFSGKRVGIILSGGNLDLRDFARLEESSELDASVR